MTFIIIYSLFNYLDYFYIFLYFLKIPNSWLH